MINTPFFHKSEALMSTIIAQRMDPLTTGQHQSKKVHLPSFFLITVSKRIHQTIWRRRVEASFFPSYVVFINIHEDNLLCLPATCASAM
jgi:hypothetical protein